MLKMYQKVDIFNYIGIEHSSFTNFKWSLSSSLLFILKIEYHCNVY